VDAALVGRIKPQAQCANAIATKTHAAQCPSVIAPYEFCVAANFDQELQQ
jgi:hypothetical protein